MDETMVPAHVVDSTAERLQIRSGRNGHSDTAVEHNSSTQEREKDSRPQIFAIVKFEPSVNTDGRGAPSATYGVGVERFMYDKDGPGSSRRTDGITVGVNKKSPRGLIRCGWNSVVARLAYGANRAFAMTNFKVSTIRQAARDLGNQAKRLQHFASNGGSVNIPFEEGAVQVVAVLPFKAGTTAGRFTLHAQYGHAMADGKQFVPVMPAEEYRSVLCAGFNAVVLNVFADARPIMAYPVPDEGLLREIARDLTSQANRVDKHNEEQRDR